MPTLLDPAECARTVRRIQALAAGTKPLWGRMNAAQMLAHCQVAMQVASGELKLKRMWIGFLFGGLARRMVLSDKPFRRNGPTAPEFRIREARDFEPERAGLIDRVQRFCRDGAAGITREPHPFFGPMTTAEWETLQWKHLDHHLQQFGV